MNRRLYSVIWSPKSKRKLAKLDEKLVARIADKLRIVAETPYDFIEKIKGEEGYKVRAGDYRVLVDVNKEKRELHVLTVMHRKKAYKKK
jgi:mRNA interferase RelE/StbE